MAKIKKDTGIIVEVHHNLKGSINEHIATAWLLKDGYDVFRNVSPRGRADLIAKKWDSEDWIAIDVKSEHFNLRGTGPMNGGQRNTSKQYELSNLRYIVVNDDGSCKWYHDLDHPKDGEVFEGDDYWVCPTSGHRFLHPSHFIDRKEWSFFAYWAIEYQGQYLKQTEIDVCWEVKREPGYKNRDLTSRQQRIMDKIRSDCHSRVTGLNKPVNDNNPLSGEVAE